MDGGTRELRADCARCVGLCCVVPAFTASSDFAFGKPAGVACRHLAGDHRCRIHAQLRERGMRGCTVYDCFGAGQRVTQAAGSPSAPSAPSASGAADAADAFEAVRALHEMLWYVVAAMELSAARPVHGRLHEAYDELDALAGDLADAGGAARFDAAGLRDRVNGLLREASRLARDGVRAAGDPAPDLRGALLVGADLRRRDLRAADLRGAVLVGADLRGADLTGADLTGADLRGARVDPGQLLRALFVTHVQQAAAVETR
jgi:hypothetical protein